MQLFCAACRLWQSVDVGTLAEQKHVIGAWFRDHQEHRGCGFREARLDDPVDDWRPTEAYVRFSLKHRRCCLGNDRPRRPGSCNGERFHGIEPSRRRKGGDGPTWLVWTDLRADLDRAVGHLTPAEIELAGVLIADERYGHAAKRLGFGVDDLKRAIAGVVERVTAAMRGEGGSQG